MVKPHDDTRQTILDAAIQVFAETGEAGARTDAIARAAGVNKALLHYYFGTKEGLYEAALDAVSAGLMDRYRAVLDGPGSPGERLLRHFLNHFDHLASGGTFSRLMAHEMMRSRAGQPGRLDRVVALVFQPLHRRIGELMREGVASGQLRAVDPGAAIVSLTGSNVFYFVSAPVFRELTGVDPREPAWLARQRAALLDFAASILYTDPAAGRTLAAAILAGETRP